MKASELVKKINERIKENGDCEIYVDVTKITEYTKPVGLVYYNKSEDGSHRPKDSIIIAI